MIVLLPYAPPLRINLQSGHDKHMTAGLDQTTGPAPERWTNADYRLAVEVHVGKDVGSVGHFTPIVASSCDVYPSAYLFGDASFNCTQFPKATFCGSLGAILPRSRAGRTPRPEYRRPSDPGPRHFFGQL